MFEIETKLILLLALNYDWFLKDLIINKIGVIL